MNKSIEYIKPEIFPDERILSGVTKKNLHLFQPFGFSISSAEILQFDETEKNLELFSAQFSISRDRIKMKKQIHSDIIEIADFDTDTSEADGLITNLKGLMILVKVADCAGVLLYDKAKNAIGAIHSGWRGTQQQIVKKAIDLMKTKYSSNSNDILAFISPCASGDVYEVGEEVAVHFPESVQKQKNGKYLFDNKNEIRLQLLSSGLIHENIEISDICTIQNQDYHSFRRDKEKSGRMAAFIMLKH
jgi:YfiH family protein